MLRTSKTRVGSDTFHMEVAPGYVVDQEGVPLVAHQEGGKTYAKPCQGTPTERLLGFSLSRNGTVDRATIVHDYEVPVLAPYTIETNLALISTQLGITLKGSPLQEVVTAPQAGEYKVEGTRLVFNAAQAGTVVHLHGAYTPNAVQAVAFQGQTPAGGLPSVAAATIGIIRSGTVYTDRYDVNANFDSDTTDPVVLRTAPNGLITVGGNGAALTSHVEFLEAPSTGNGFLGMRALG